MTTVTIPLVEDRLDITALNIAFDGMPVASASSALVNGHGGDLERLGEALRESFAEGASWCRVGGAVHTVSREEVELRLVPRSDTPAWHADYFKASWGNCDGARIPPDFRLQYAAYVDRREKAREPCLQNKDLRAAAAKSGARGVDRLVRHHQAQLAEWYSALDHLLCSLFAAQPLEKLPKWAASVAKDELLDVHRTREYLTSAVLEYHHGDSGPRPETVFGNLYFHLSTVDVELVTA
ncbi:hypothetical protein ACIQCG_01135 [Streptomyces noursei]|uniref:hypothetical protein n=1 Tax=Streptomyces noursei TaxID=1971 RepID=UPI00382DD912